MSGFSALLESIKREDEAFSVTLPDSWLQGRTAYGGLSAALCVEAALRAVGELAARTKDYSRLFPNITVEED